MQISIDNVNVEFLKDTALRITDVDDKDYFGEMYKGYVSNSSLKHINPDEGGSPYKFINHDKDETSALELGSAVHKMLLESDKYFVAKMDKPNGKTTPIIDGAYKLTQANPNLAFREAVKQSCVTVGYYNNKLSEARIDAVIEQGKPYYDYLVKSNSDSTQIVLDAALKWRMEKAIESVQRNNKMMSLLKPTEDGIFDIKYFAEDVVTMEYMACIGTECSSDPIKLKSKIDNWSIDFDNKIVTLNDLKTTSSAIQYFMGRQGTEWTFTDNGFGSVAKFIPGSFQKYHYHRQMAMYKNMLYWHCAKEYGVDETWQFNVNMLVVETVEPFNTIIYPVSDVWLQAGAEELALLLTRVAWHTTYGWDKIMEFR